MEWYQLAVLIFGSGILSGTCVAIINQYGNAKSDKRNREYALADKADEKNDKTDDLDKKVESYKADLDTKVEKYKVDTDKQILDLRRDMTAMEQRFQEIFTNLDLKLDDSLRHVAKGNALLLAQSINSIAYRAGKIIKDKTVGEDEYRNLNVEYCRVCELIGASDDPDVVYLTGLIKKIDQLRR